MSDRGRRNKRVRVQGAGLPIPDGSGGYTIPYTDLNPPYMWAEIQGPPSPEEAVAGSVERAIVSHTVTMDYHPELTRASRLVLDEERYLYVRGKHDVDERHHTLILNCEEAA